MRCYHCGTDLSEHNFCTNCGADVGLYKKIIRTSNALYNQGLEKARVRDLSGAVVVLRQSLKFNKNNIKARNLLGLVYYEMGEVVAALSEWVISMNLRNKKNVAADYIERLQSNKNEMDTLNKSIKNYNQAYQYCLQPDGKDIAIVQLKRVIGANPKLVRAYQLLALVLISTGKPKAALQYLETAKKIDINSTITLRYIKDAEDTIRAAEEARKKKKGGASDDNENYAVVKKNDIGQTVIEPVYNTEKRGSGAVLNILIGMAVGFAIAFFLILPGKIQAAKTEILEEKISIGNQLDEKNLVIKELEKTNSDQADTIKNLEREMNAYSGTEGTLKSMEDLLAAANVYFEKDQFETDPTERYLKVADYIADIDESTWTDATSENYKNLYYALKNEVGSVASVQYLNLGKNCINEELLADAVSYLERAVMFDPSSEEALWSLMIAYRTAENNIEAKNSCEKIIELFPNTWYSREAEKYLTEYE